ncbi:hypothetical protein GGD38_001483 [Chitinophagaceae bacterium OAS944]|nr:hypothetical protein [Chitinophagaceae bacterium OAS944]
MRGGFFYEGKYSLKQLQLQAKTAKSQRLKAESKYKIQL